MKTTTLRSAVAVSTTSLLLAFAGPSSGDEASSERSQAFKGTVVTVDDRNQTITAREFWLWPSKTFNVGDGCKVLVGDGRREATLKDLAPGNRVEVQYTSVGGVNVARQIAENYRHFTGHIVALGPEGQSLTVEQGLSKRSFALADDYNVVTSGKKGAMGDLKIGHKVVVAYSSAGDSNLAHQIAQNSLSFVGTVEAMDAETRTLKAEHFMTDRRFHLADDCPIVINGKPDGKLSDLRLGDTVMFNYDNVHGVLVANRIARETESARPENSQTAQSKAAYP